MSIGPDIKEVLQEVGTRFRLERVDGTIVNGEYLDYDTNSQATKPFIREFFVSGYVAYDSKVKAGDYIVILADGRRFVVMNSTPELFEDQAIKYDMVLYKCNHTVEVFRRTDKPTYDGNYDRIETWTSAIQGVHCLITEAIFGSALVDGGKDLSLYEMGITKNQMFVPAGHDIRAMDRIVVSPTEKYKVEYLEKRKFDNVSIVYLTEDERG